MSHAILVLTILLISPFIFVMLPSLNPIERFVWAVEVGVLYAVTMHGYLIMSTSFLSNISNVFLFSLSLQHPSHP